MICCRELADFLLEYVSGEMPEPTRAAFEEHLAACPPCVAYMKSYVKCVELAKATLCEESRCVPPMPEELVRAILAARGCK